LLLLVRDRALPSRPVIGIAALGNSIVHQGPRDEAIGWTPKELIDRIENDSSVRWPQWLLGQLERMLGEVYIDDFLKEKVISRAKLERPTRELVKELREFGLGNRHAHSLDHTAAEVEREVVNEKFDWKARAQTTLFRSKRADLLATLLDARRVFQELGFDQPNREALAKAMERATGRLAVQTVLRRVKSEHIGIDMLDITVCGAIPPYNSILGGKLVAMLLASPEVVRTYDARYGKACSVIASSIAGRAVVRKPNLVWLGTTSLYGVGSSQYNRIVIPAGEVGGKPGQEIRYRELGITEGFGYTHFSAQTSAEAEKLIDTHSSQRRVKSIFGEGVSPRFRKLRIGLDFVGLPSSKLLRHGSPRIVYGVALASNFKDVLIRRGMKPEYVLPISGKEDITQRIGDYWIKRWLSNRILNEEVLADVEKHTLVYPIEHGARVPLPEMSEGPTLFEYAEM
jgi:hypothetical protein